ncbi:DUF4192 family protein [Microbacterium sp.]|uniref:DUF4192 family protein n=1 Tax=Microbacterium sp. TaxID=51671 RepID=UPI002811C061|nr:DUF4192 family protein [Microbacterium sp.]
MSTILKASDSAELLGIVPTLAGFTPRQSLVLLPFHGKRTYGAMRLDLPADDVDPEEYADTVLTLLTRVVGIDAVAAVVYTDESAQRIPDGLLLPRLGLIETVLAVCHDAGLRVLEGLCVTPEGWGDYLIDDPVISPMSGIPWPAPVPGAGDVSGDQWAGTELPPGDLADRERVGRALCDLEKVLERHRRGVAAPAADEHPQAIDAAELLLDNLPGFAEALLEAPDDDDPFACAALLWCLTRPMLRDAILVQWATNLEFGCRALDAQLVFGENGEGVPDAVGEVFLGRGVRPDPDRLGCALQLVRRALSRAPRDARPGAFTAAAWLSWALGRSTHAGHYVEQALAIDPQHRMAALIGTLLSAAILPEWTLRRGPAAT